LSTKYLEKSTEPFTSKGSFEWRPDGRTIVLKSSDGTQRLYRVEENRLRQSCFPARASRPTVPNLQ